MSIIHNYSKMSTEMYQFIKNCVPYSLTVGDIKKLNVGDSLNVVIWDPNFKENHIWEKLVEKHLLHCVLIIGKLLKMIHYNQAHDQTKLC